MDVFGTIRTESSGVCRCVFVKYYVWGAYCQVPYIKSLRHYSIDCFLR